MRRAAAAALIAFCAAAAHADGGRLRFRRDAADLRVAVFTAPDPLTVGPADISVLVQDRESGDVLLDARVHVRLRSPRGEWAIDRMAGTGANRLLRSVAAVLPEPGEWGIEVEVVRAGAGVRIAGTLSVEPAPGAVRRVWPFLAIPPLGVGLFAFRRVLVARRRTQ